MKRIFILCAALAGLLPLAAEAQVNYAVSGNTAYVTSSPNAAGNILIASTYNGYPVTSIAAGAFDDCSSLTSVTISNSITSIGANAFSFCSSLTNIAVSGGNPDYSSVNGVLFNQNQTLLIQFPGGLGGSYTVPNSVTNIEDYAFADCSGLANVAIGSSVTGIGVEAFEACSSLTNVTIGNNVTSIGEEAFDDCSSLTGVTIPNNVTSIEVATFIYCSSLKKVTIGNSVTSIGDRAFLDCLTLTNAIIPNSVTSIGNGPFEECSSLTNIAVSAGNPDYNSANGVLFNKNQTLLIQFPGGLGGSYTIPNSVTNIGAFAFLGCSLASLTIGTSITSVGEDMFAFCSSLTSVTIPNSVTSIADGAFYYCNSLTNVTFQGNAPSLSGSDQFYEVAAGATVYYYYGTSGWGSTYGGLPAVALFSPPQIGGSGGARIQNGNFSFTITGVANQTIVVEASTNLVNWQPVWTNILSGTSTNFTDPRWTNYPSRFYRAQ